jgi:hypothetical protein
MIDLADYQFELCESSAEDADGLVFGAGTPIPVNSFDAGVSDNRTADAERPVADGTAFGRDFRDARLLAWELTACSWSPAVTAEAALSGYRTGTVLGADRVAEALDAAEQIETAWASDRIRLSPGAVQVMRWQVGGRTRRVYGRPRKCSSKPDNLQAGQIGFQAEFQAEDDLFYDDQRSVVTIPIAAPPSAWTTWPLRWPLVWQRSPTANSGTILVGGTRATWPSFTINGPLANPEIVVGGYGSLTINTTLLFDQALYIDTRPWNRGVRRENGANLAGVLDPRSTPLTLLRVPPGSYSVALDGIDPTGTASLVVEHRDAYSSW